MKERRFGMVDKRVRDGSKVYERIREGILRLELRPGSIIDEATLCKAMEVSRTPVREAIIQLIADDLVIRDGRSVRVAPLDFDEIPRLGEALLVSSRMIHRLAACNCTAAEFMKIEKAMKAFENGIELGDGMARSELNLSFHLAISEAAHNRYFQRFYEHALIGNFRLARAAFSQHEGRIPGKPLDKDTEAHLQETCRQHREMVEAIRNGDQDRSEALAIEHEALSRGRLQRLLFSAPTKRASEVPKLTAGTDAG